MAIAWSRISSKVIAHPPYTNAACRRQCGNGKAVWAHVYRIWLTKESRKSMPCMLIASKGILRHWPAVEARTSSPQTSFTASSLGHLLYHVFHVDIMVRYGILRVREPCLTYAHAQWPVSVVAAETGDRA